MTMTPYIEGRDCYCDDGSLSDNPYELGTVEHREWRDGWDTTEANDPLADHNMDDEGDSLFPDSVMDGD